MINGAIERLVVVAPAVWPQVAMAICERWRVLGSQAVTVVLDSDPEAYRLGYGELAALQELQQTATEVGAEIHHQPGLRIGVVIADNKTLIYTPTAKLVEAGENTHGAANAICLGAAPRNVEADLGLGPGAARQVGRRLLGIDQVESVKNDLEANPPQKFDLARKVRVFNSFIEFVELEVLGTEVSRRTVTIPSHLLAVADARTREQLRATLRLVPSDCKLSGEAIDKDRKLLTKR